MVVSSNVLHCCFCHNHCDFTGSTTQPPLPVGFWPLDKLYGSKELTGRSLAISWPGESPIFSDDGPFRSKQGLIL